MPPTKDQIIQQLQELKIEHDPKASKDELLALLPATPDTESYGNTRVVQLTCNAAGHQVGETFRESEAAELGILDRCRPFAA